MQSLGMDFPDQMNSINEVQRLIGLSLSKIQMGRTQRGGLPLHRNLLVATVLSKARDLYMQETMYMNYKIMSAQQRLGNEEQNPFEVRPRFPEVNHQRSEVDEDDTCDADDDSESDVDDEGDEEMNDSEASSDQLPYRVSTVAAMMMQAAVAVATSSATPTSPSLTNHAAPVSTETTTNTSTLQSQAEPDHTMANKSSAYQHNYNSNQPVFLQSTRRYLPLDAPENHLLNQQSFLMEDRFPSGPQQQHYHNHLQPVATPPSPTRPVSPLSQDTDVPLPRRLSPRDEGFIDDHDCDCVARNFSTLETHVPFQYCYNCAHFQSANGRGPTLVPSPPACPSPLPADHQFQSMSKTAEAKPSSTPSSSAATTQNPDADFTIYDMDSKSTEFKKPMSTPAMRQGTKRSRVGDSHQELPKKACLWMKRESESASYSTSLAKCDNSQSPDTETFHPAYRYDTGLTNGGPQAMEIDQITSLVSIFSFGQHLMTTNESSSNIPHNRNLEVVNSTTDISNCVVTSNSKSSGDDSDSESDTSSDSGHFGDELETSNDKIQSEDAITETLSRPVVVININTAQGPSQTTKICTQIQTVAQLASASTKQTHDCKSPPSTLEQIKTSFESDKNSDEDSDNESDKSSDSGHSSDDSIIDTSVSPNNLVQTVMPPSTESVFN